MSKKLSFILGIMFLAAVGCSKAWDKEVKVDGAVLGQKVEKPGDAPAPDSFKLKTYNIDFVEGQKAELMVEFAAYQSNLISDLDYDLQLPASVKDATHRLVKIDESNYAVAIEWDVPEFVVPRTSNEISEKATLTLKAKAKSGQVVAVPYKFNVQIMKNILRPEILGVVRYSDLSMWGEGNESKMLEQLASSAYKFLAYKLISSVDEDPVFEADPKAKPEVFEVEDSENDFVLILRDPESRNPKGSPGAPIVSVVNGLDTQGLGKLSDFGAMNEITRSEEDPSIYFVKFNVGIGYKEYTGDTTEGSFYIEARSQHSPNMVSKRFQFKFDILDVPVPLKHTIGAPITFLAEVRNTYQFVVSNPYLDGTVYVDLPPPCNTNSLRCTCTDFDSSVVTCSVEWTPALGQPSIKIPFEFFGVSKRASTIDNRDAFPEKFLDVLTGLINDTGKETLYPVFSLPQTEVLTIQISNKGGKN